MLKKGIFIFLACAVLSGCGNAEEKESSSEQTITADKAYSLYTEAVKSLNQDKIYIHNVTSINMNAGNDNAVFRSLESEIDKTVESGEICADIKVVSTSDESSTEFQGQLKGNTYTYTQNLQEYSEETDYETVLDDLLVYDIDFLPEYVQNAVYTQDLQNNKQVNITIDNTSGRDFVKNAMPQLENIMDVDEDVRFDNIYIEFLVDDQGKMLSTAFNLDVAFLSDENETPFSVSVARDFE